jgi:hypothetical protein
MTTNDQARTLTTRLDPPTADTVEPTALTDRYVALWNESDPAKRRSLVEAVWAPSGGQILLSAPEEVRTVARSLGFDTVTFEARGHDSLFERVTRAFEEFVAPGTYRFRRQGDAVRISAGMVSFKWEMIDMKTGEVAGAGVNVLLLENDGRVRVDHLMVEP